MGNFFCQIVKRSRDERECKKLVEEHSVSTGDAASNVGPVWREPFSPATSDLTILTREEYRWDSSYFLNLNVEDARMVTLDSGLAMAEGVWVKKETPLHNELCEKTKEDDSMLIDLEFGVELTQQKTSGFREKDLDEVFHPLKVEEHKEVFHTLDGGNSCEILITHEPSNIRITREVLQCLRPGAWLNDEVINLYLELLKERERRERREPKKFLTCHFFNTFFFKKLISGGNGYDFRAVKRWTTQKKLGYALIECDKVFVPIHKDIHWCLAVINVKDETFQYLDSLGGMDTHVLEVLAIYFMEEAWDKSAKEVDTRFWKKKIVDDLPLQINDWDCGMFMLKYMDFYSRGFELCFSQEHISYFRMRTAKEILRLRAE